MRALLFGFILGFFSVGIHWVVSAYLRRLNNRYFIWAYSGGILLRFLIVLPLFALLIVLTKNEPLLFTFSFILSYIFFSVTEILWLSRRSS